MTLAPAAPPTAPRNLRLDALRVAAAFAVVCLHVSGGVVVHAPDPGRVGWWFGNLTDAFSRWCVPVFVMLSGALLLAPGRGNSSLAAFYRRRGSRLLVPLLFWTGLSLLNTAVSRHGLGMRDIGAALLSGMLWSHLWFLYMLVGLYAVTPALQHFANTASRPVRLSAIVVALITTTGYDCWRRLADAAEPSAWLHWPLYVGFFLLGHWYVTERESRPQPRLLVVCTLLCGLVVAALTAALLPLGSLAWQLMYSYLNPLVMAMSCCIFASQATNPRPLPPPVAAAVTRLAPLTLGIYLLHPFLLGHVIPRLGFTATWIHPAVGIPVTALVAFLVSAVIVWIMTRLPWIRHTVA